MKQLLEKYYQVLENRLKTEKILLIVSNQSMFLKRINKIENYKRRIEQVLSFEEELTNEQQQFINTLINELEDYEEELLEEQRL